MSFVSKLPQTETTIFTVMSKMAKEHNAINLGQGFPDFDCDIKLRELISKELNRGHNQYCPMPGLLELRESIADKIEDCYSIHINAEEQICITAGATQALFTAIMAFVHPGDEVIILEPAYDSYRPSIQIAGGTPIPYTLVGPDYTIDWDQFNTLINPKTRMIIINTPHNPTGSILRDKDLKALESIVRDRDIIVLSDEVYEHLIYDDEEHRSVLRYPELAHKSIAVYSFGKTLHATGWKIGYAIGEPSLIDEFKRVHQWNVFSVNSFLQYALAEYIKDPSVYESLPAFFQAKRDLLKTELAGSALKPLASKGTYFQLYDYSDVSDMNDIDFAQYLTLEIGVATIPLSPFYTRPIDSKVIRLCFAKKNSTLHEAAKRLSTL